MKMVRKWEVSHIESHSFDTVLRMIRALGKRPVLVGIDGQGGAGKSTFAAQLTARLEDSFVLVEGDDFYRDMSDRDRVLLGARQGVDQYFDWQRLQHEVLEPVARGEAILRYQRYDWDSAAMGNWVQTSMPGVVVLEGVYTLRPELRHLLDVKITSRPTKRRGCGDRPIEVRIPMTGYVVGLLQRITTFRNMHLNPKRTSLCKVPTR